MITKSSLSLTTHSFKLRKYLTFFYTNSVEQEINHKKCEMRSIIQFLCSKIANNLKLADEVHNSIITIKISIYFLVSLFGVAHGVHVTSLNVRKKISLSSSCSAAPE